MQAVRVLHAEGQALLNHQGDSLPLNPTLAGGQRKLE
jgi:hypothetical protein